MNNTNFIYEGLTTIKRLQNNDQTLDKDQLKDKDQILYHFNTLNLKKGDHNPFYPDLRKILGKIFKDEIAPIYSLFLHSLPNYDRVLDLGCGDGSYLLEHAKVNPFVVLNGVDNRNLDIADEVNFHMFDLLGGNYDTLPNTDILLANEFFHLFSDKDISKMVTKLKERYAGKTLIVTENKFAPHLDERLRRLSNGRCITPDEMAELLGSKGPIVSFTPNHYIMAVTL